MTVTVASQSGLGARDPRRAARCKPSFFAERSRVAPYTFLKSGFPYSFFLRLSEILLIQAYIKLDVMLAEYK